jgi:hypothetical protein
MKAPPRLILALAAMGACACAVDDGPGRLAADVPDRAAFTGPGKVLVGRCGSLDCHGNPQRNYRLFGYGGGRLDPAHRPDAPDTTAAELAVDYDGTVGVEPERTRAVATGGASVDTMTLIRKARGGEHHKGGLRLIIGSPTDACVVGWLTRAPNDAACAAALDELQAP